jgi:DNA-binding transcriptional LysR family regulator
MDKFAAMRTFVRIVDAGSLTAASDSLGTSLPTVVRTLAALERELGVTLLRRTTRRLHLTDDGSQYLDRCRDILAATQEAEDVLVARRTEPVGKLSVTASVLFGRHYLAPILYDFLRRHPKVSADVLFVDRVVNLIEEGMDVAIRIAHLRDSSLVAIPVGRVRRVICASEQYLRHHGIPQVPDDVRGQRCVRHLGLVPRSEWHFRVRNRAVAIPIASVVTGNDIDSALNASTVSDSVCFCHTWSRRTGSVANSNMSWKSSRLSQCRFRWFICRHDCCRARCGFSWMNALARCEVLASIKLGLSSRRSTLAFF